MVETLARAVADAPPSGVRTIEVEEIRQPRQSTKTPR
jgi:hypothetical protein